MNPESTLPLPENRIFIGKIVKVRGLRGDLKILPWTFDPARFQEMENVWIQISDNEASNYTIKRVRVENGTVYLRLKDCPTRELAEPLVGGELFIDEKQRGNLPEDNYYLDDLVGCTVKSIDNIEFGVIREVLQQGGHDIWLVGNEEKEIMIPAVKEFIKSVDISNKIVHVELPDGLEDLS